MTSGEAPMTVEIERSGGDELFALLQKVLPQHLLSRGMHALARSRNPYEQIEAIEQLLRDSERFAVVLALTGASRRGR